MERHLMDEIIENCSITVNVLQYNTHRAGEGFDKLISFDYDMICVLEGAYRYQIDGRTYSVKGGEIILVPAGCAFSGCATEDSKHYFCHFSPSHDLFGEACICRDTELVQLYARICSGGDEPFLLRNVIKLLLYRIAQNIGLGCTEVIPEGIQKAVDYIKKNPRKNVSGKELAEIANMNYSYFSRRFHECMGISPMEYRNNVRLEEAKRLLLQGMSVSEAAEVMGFSDMFAFSKKFKKQYKVAPSRIRHIQI